MLSARIEGLVSTHQQKYAVTAPRLLLTGDRQTGKTSLAFAYAFDLASNGGRPLYICN